MVKQLGTAPARAAYPAHSLPGPGVVVDKGSTNTRAGDAPTWDAVCFSGARLERLVVVGLCLVQEGLQTVKRG